MGFPLINHLYLLFDMFMVMFGLYFFQAVGASADENTEACV